MRKIITGGLIIVIGLMIVIAGLYFRNAQQNGNGGVNQFGNCKPLVYNGSISNKINFVFIPAEEMKDEQELINSVKDLFDENKENSFYTIYPYNEYKDDFNFFYLNEYDYAEDIKTIKNVLKEKCPELSNNIYQVISTGTKLGGKRHNYLRTVDKVSYQSIGSFHKPSLAVFLHEVGHSLGGLGEGYGVSPSSFGSFAYYKENYDNNSNIPLNWDIEGCPKWCSGQINTNSICYSAYTELKSCLLSHQTDSNQEAESCVSSFFNSLENDFGLLQPVDCNFGINCIDNTNCWFIGNGFFRAYDKDLMYSGSDINDGRMKNYGPAGDKQIKETIELLKLWNYQKNNLDEVNFEIVDSYIHSFSDRNEIYVEFRLSDSTDSTLSIFKDDILDNIFYVKYKKPEEQTYSNIQRINKHTGGNYYVAFTTYRSEKELPVDSLSLNFIFVMELPKFKKTWNFATKSQ